MRRALAAIVCLACGSPPAHSPFEWRVDLSELDDALLSAWVGGPEQAIAVGGSAGRGVVYEWDGERWDAPLLPDGSGILWWTWVAPGGDAFAVGEDATVLRRAGGIWRREPVDDLVAADQALYGVFGFGDDDVWVVGGTLVPRADAGIILHWDGLVWSGEPAAALLFKVWGAAAGDLWAVGEGGAILHGDGTAWSETPSPTGERLIAVYGRATDDVYAVGGGGAGVVLAWDGAAWSSFATAPEALSGVFTAPGRPLYVGGARGYLARLGDDPATATPLFDVDFHALAGAGTVVIAVGADLQAPSASHWRGALASHGDSLAGPIEPPPPPPDAPAPADAAASSDASGPAEGEPCAVPDGGGEGQCRADLTCWLLIADGDLICTRACDSPADCGAYGADPCCAQPGPQTLTKVCIRRGTASCP